MTNDILLIVILSIILWGSPFLSKLINVPTSVVEILLGSILATFGIIHKNANFDLIAHFGFLYLMFLAGLEVSLRKLLNSPTALLTKASLYVLIVFLLSYLIGYIMKLNIIFIVALPLISIGLLATLSKTYGKDAKWIEIAFTVGVMGEIVSIIALTILDAAGEVGFGVELIKKLTILFVFMALIILAYKVLDLLLWWLPELKEKLMPVHNSSEQDLRFSISLFFLLIVTMLLLHLELALGVFIAGIAIGTFFHKKELEEKMASFGFGFLIPIFFVHVGTTFDLTSITMPGVFRDAIIIVTISIGVKVFSTFILKKYLSPREATMVGLSLSMPLTLLIAVATIGYHSNHINILNYYSLVLASILEILVSVIAIMLINKKIKKEEEKLKMKETKEEKR
jgi:Kef-type K+ transport system membrane component KefB